MKEYNYTLIIPHYNIPHLLRRLLSSIPKREDLQVIVVDDCSTKNIEELEELKKHYNWIEWYSTDTNGGGGKARNVGLEHAIGEYLIFADADDYFNECFNDCLENYIDTYYDLIIFDITGENNIPLSERIKEYNSLINLYETNQQEAINQLRLHYYSPWAKFIKKKLIDNFEIKFEEVSIHNDVWFSGLIGIYATNIIVAHEKIYTLTERVYSVSKVIKKSQRLSRTRTFSKLNNMFHQNKFNYMNLQMMEPAIYFLKRINIIYFLRCVFIMKRYGFSFLKILLHNYLLRK